uniref:Uncharacterized protein n=1 Tax=Tetraselmis sp. GSL018 TaxID=582737 RepID=A0A061RG08_9CHLO
MGREYPISAEVESQDNLLIRYGRHRRQLLELAKQGAPESAGPLPEEFAMLSSKHDFSMLLKDFEGLTASVISQGKTRFS